LRKKRPQGLDPHKDGLLNTLGRVFEPLARLIVDHGVSSPEVERLLRSVCVHQAAKTDAANGKKPNASRVALVTGVDRGEVTRILKTYPGTGVIESTRHRVNRVLAGWHSDGDYSSGGRPLVLPIKTGDHKRKSFWALAKRYAPGVYPGLILSELLRVSAAERLEDGCLRARTREYRAAEFSKESMSEIGARAHDLMQTLLNNATEASWPRICRTVERTDIDPKFLPLIRKMIADRSEYMLSGVQEEFKSARWNHTDPAGRGVRIGVTVFTHEDLPQEDTTSVKHTDSRSERTPKARRRTKRGHAK
jgi:hypothetical protein